MKKIGFLFGAGAELAYGLPSGGKFALDIFRHKQDIVKQEFKDLRKKIALNTDYAANWLPPNFNSNNVGSFGKSMFYSIIRDTIEHNRDKIIDIFSNFDKYSKILEKQINEDFNVTIKDILEKVTNTKLNNSNMKQVVSYISDLSSGDNIFQSKYMSSLLTAYKTKDFFNDSQKKELKKILRFLFQLQLGALSEELIRKINDNVFKNTDDDIDIFDDFEDIIQLNYSAVGELGFQYLIDHLEKESPNSDAEFIVHFARQLLELIYSFVIDYKTLIDSNWHYLYTPKKEWAKFCKICIFLMSAREYIKNTAKNLCSNKGYYDDLSEALNRHIFSDECIIATTNYNEIIDKKLNKDIVHLNGSTDTWYDPYLNKISSKQGFENEKEIHIIVPLIFTQSGTKPMTSIKMSEKYVNLYQEWQKSEAIVSIGFGYNSDDEHINSIIRTLVEEDDKMLYVLEIDQNKDIEILEDELQKKLKISKRQNIKIILINNERNIIDQQNTSWIEYISKI